MKKRNAKVFAMFMTSMMTFTSIAPATVYAAEDNYEIVTEAEAEEAAEEVVEETDEEFVEEDEEVVEVVEEEAAEAVEEAEETVDEDTEAVRMEGSAIAQGDCGKDGDVKWDLYEDGELVITAHGQYKMLDYELDPIEEITTAPWGEYAEKIKTVTITGDLVRIGAFAFAGCDNIEKVNMRQSITQIGAYAFLECSALTNLVYKTNENAKVSVYEEGAFMNCVSLVEIPLTRDLSKIDNFAFYGCKSLQSGRNSSGQVSDTFKFEGTIEWIGVAAFWGCEKIAKVEFPSSIKEIRGGYSGDKTLEGHANVMGAEGKLGAFAGCTGLQSITFKTNETGDGLKGIEELGDFAFYGCSKLSSVKLVETLDEVGYYAFADCTGMTTAEIQNSDVERLNGTFKGCTKLGKVTIGTWVDFVDPETGIRIVDVVDPYTKELLDGGYASKIEEIGNRTFENCVSLTQVEYTPVISWIRRVGDRAFYNCQKLPEVPLSYDLEVIGDAAFENCFALKYVVIPNGTEEIGANAFYECKDLDHIYLPSSLNTIGKTCFNARDGISALRLIDVYYQGTEDDWTALMKNNDCLNKGNEILAYEGTQFAYKTNKYYYSNIGIEVPENVKVAYNDGKLTISWDAVKIIVDPATGRTVNPDHYEVYQNHNGSSTLDDQWANGKTPAWGEPRIVDGSDNSWTYDIGTTLKEGDIYHFKVRAIADDVHGGMLSDCDADATYVVQTSQSAIKVDAITFENATYNMFLGDELPISITETSTTGEVPTEKVTYTWTPANASVAGVTSTGNKSATITANAVGTTTITVTGRDGLSATCTINVGNKSDIPVNNVTMNVATANVAKDGTITLKITIDPDNADRGIIKWESSNNQVATVAKSSNEVEAIVTGVRVGDTATITATTNNGTGKSASCVVTVVETTEAAVPAFVERMYNVCLDRPSDAAGKQGWVDNLQAGTMDGAAIAKAFVFSDEMINKNLSNEDFVKTMYRCMMGREADAEGLNGWVGQLKANNMSRSEVAAAFVASNEFDGICASYGIARGNFDASDAAVEKFVNRFYQLTLQRDADSAGLYGWVNNLKIGAMDGAALSKAFFLSEEMTNRGLNDSDFVELLYTTMMGRPSDAEGKGGWLAAIANGTMTRTDVLASFVQSPEFTNICATYGINRGTL